MKLLLDMNLSPQWSRFFHENGVEAVHWSTIGRENASDAEIMSWARINRHVVFTHDLDFGIILAHSRDNGPSVIQVRTQDITPENFGPTLLRILDTHRDILLQGALLTLDESKSRIRILPINSGPGIS